MGRKQKTIHYLYKTTCKVTGKYYVGMHSTSNLDDGYMGSGKRLRHSIRKYGKENHVKEILEFFESRELLIEAEKKAITEEMLCDVNCMNLMSGGTGGFISVEHMKNVSTRGNEKLKFLRENDNEWLRKRKLGLSLAAKKAYDEGRSIKYNVFDWTGLKHLEETKQKISNSNKGRGMVEQNSQFGTCWITNGIENRKVKKDEVIPEGWHKGRTLLKLYK
jgi:hypothetical protein